MSYRFHKIYYTVLFSLFLACTPDYDTEPLTYSFVPESLQITEPTGIRLENYVVKGQVDINVKLPQDGEYRIKIKDLSGKLVSQEKLAAKEGDNILKIYVNALPVSSYTVELFDTSNVLLGKELFAMKN